MATNSSFYLGSTDYGATVDTLTNPARKTNSSFYPGGYDYKNVTILLSAALVGSPGVSGDITRIINLLAPLSGIITVTGDVRPSTIIGAAISGTISITGDLGSAAAWDYDAEYLLHF